MSRLRASCRLFALFALVSGCADDGPGSVTPAPTPDGGPVDAASDGHHDAHLGDADGAADAPPFDGPTKLSETGLYADITTGALAPGVAEFTVRFPLWSDGAEKQRYLALPAGSTIDTTVIDVWTFPVGTKAWKSFTRDGKRLETRLLWKRPEGWLMVAYAWNEAGTEAIATPEGTQNALGTNHDVPSAAQCRQCHDNVGDVLIGVGAIQLSQENGGGFLSTLIKQGSLSPPLTAELPVPGDGEVEAAIGYLHGNCGHCHNDESFVGKLRPLRLKLRTDAKTPEETPVYKTALYAPTLHPTLNTTQVIVPGSPGKSQLYQRMNVRGLEGMPPLATEEVDSTAMTTIWKWISGLPP
ncbi:MAG: hypothetical protein IT377_17645 [Polyangiaceae bacterium]|nr:hypothetical protein [Polyangiaceae bacterium]